MSIEIVGVVRRPETAIERATYHGHIAGETVFDVMEYFKELLYSASEQDTICFAVGLLSRAATLIIS
jgi:hypothetical protein